MNKVYWYICGLYRVTVLGAGLDHLLNRLGKERIPFWDLKWTDDCTLSLCIFARDLEALRHISNSTACEIAGKQYRGVKERIISMMQRPIFFVGVLLSATIILFCQNYLLFYDVSGNETIPKTEILRTLETLDIGFGTFGANISPKWIKDHMLNLLPQLQWVTVTQNGCKANVTVRERETAPEIAKGKGFANIIAAKAGMITDQSVFKGQRLKEAGDFVLQGELLVSGIVNLEKKFSIVYAQAEIYGKTWYRKSVVIPQKSMDKEQNGQTSRCIWLEFGKRRIKILGNSRIYDTDCDKMIIRKNITLPGGNELPISILIERYVDYETQMLTTARSAAQQYLWEYAEGSVVRDLCAGEILSQTGTVEPSDGCYRLDALFTCREMIAQTVEGKWNEEDYLHD